MNDLKRLTDEDAIGEHDRHPGEVCADIKPDREIGDAFRHLEYFLIVHSNILSGRHPIPIPEFSEALHASKWRTDIVLPQAGDNICPENLLSEKTLAMLETVSAGEVWEDMKDDCRTMRRVVEHELFRVTERGFHLRRDGTPCCTLTLQRYRVHDAGRRMKTEVPPPCPARGVERKSGKIRFYFRKYFVHIDVPDTLSQYPEVREFVNIKSLLSEADRKLLAETECDEAESLLEWIENEGYCHVRARCWTPDEESGGWMCVLSVDV